MNHDRMIKREQTTTTTKKKSIWLDEKKREAKHARQTTKKLETLNPYFPDALQARTMRRTDVNKNRTVLCSEKPSFI